MAYVTSGNLTKQYCLDLIAGTAGDTTVVCDMTDVSNTNPDALYTFENSDGEVVEFNSLVSLRDYIINRKVIIKYS